MTFATICSTHRALTTRWYRSARPSSPLEKTSWMFRPPTSTDDGTFVCQRKNAAASQATEKTHTVASRPMRVAIISDVHANEHALRAVLAAVDVSAPDALWCLGDVVGYGPEPNGCCSLVAARADLCLVGNHDLVALGELDVAAFNDEAAAAA